MNNDDLKNKFSTQRFKAKAVNESAVQNNTLAYLPAFRIQKKIKKLMMIEIPIEQYFEPNIISRIGAIGKELDETLQQLQGIYKTK